MKKMIYNSRRNFILICTTCAIFTFSACGDDFLNIAPQGSLTEALFPQTEADALLAVNAVYGSLHNWSYWYGGFPITDILSDDARKGSNPGDAARLELFDNYTFTSTSADIFPYYGAVYKSIKSANVVIEKVPPIEMDEELKSRYIAEAKFLRALFYFNLVRSFGDVPKVLTTTPEFNLARSPKTEIYNEIIIPDLLEAISALPEKTEYSASDLGRATKGAAKLLLAKVYLYRADYANALIYTTEIINSGLYALENDFSMAFSVAGQYGMESIFEVGSRPFESADLGGNQYANTQGVRGDPNKGWGFNRPSIDLINSFEAGDERKDATVIFLGETIDGVFIAGDISTNDVTYVDETMTDTLEIETYNQKIWTPGSTTVDQWGYNIRLMRYAEVLLIAAEAANETGNTGDALTYINFIRERAGLLPSLAAGQDAIRTEIRKQRRSEFAMEGERYFDLIRTGSASEVLGPLGFVSGKHELFPIPQSEIDLSGGTLTQNPGW